MELAPTYAGCACITAQAERLLTNSLVNWEGVSFVGSTLSATVTGMTVTVQSGSGFVLGDTVAWQGMYHVSNDSDKALTIAPADASLPRTDLIVFRVADSTYSGSDCFAVLEVITGVPGNPPVAPAVPDNALLLYHVNVAAGATTVTLTDMRVDWTNHLTPPGTVRMEAQATSTQFAGIGWVDCNGQAISRTRYARLFADIGTTYGAGDGSTTFNVPDMTTSGRFPRYGTPGGTGGAATHTHTMGTHTHTSAAHTHTIATHTHADAGHTHTVPAHAHGLDDGGWAQISLVAASSGGTIRIRRVNATSWTAAVSADATNVASGQASTFGAALDGATANSAVLTSGATALTTSANTSPTATGSTTPGVTGASDPGDTGSTATIPPYVQYRFFIKT